MGPSRLIWNSVQQRLSFAGPVSLVDDGMGGFQIRLDGTELRDEDPWEALELGDLWDVYFPGHSEDRYGDYGENIYEIIVRRVEKAF